MSDWHNFEMQWIGGILLLARVEWDQGCCDECNDGQWYVSQLSCLDPMSRLRIPIPRKELPRIERAILAQWQEVLDND